MVDDELTSRARRIVQQASGAPPEEREHVLSESCGDNSKLRELVDQLFQESSLVLPPRLPGSRERSSVPALPLGAIIDGEYEVLQELSAGAQGVVYRCRERTLGKVVAVKMHVSGSVGQELMDTFLEEGRRLATLTDRNVVQVHRAGTHAGVPYIVMEYVEGRTLQAELTRGLGARRALPIMAQVARGLCAIHAQGIVHGDVAPRNVLISGDGHATIIDLGLSRLKAPAASDAERLGGTVPYLAPEVIRGERTGILTDIFSYGALLYESAAGVKPFGDDGNEAVLRRILEDDPPPLAEHHPELPPRLLRIIDHCLQKPPELRMQHLDGVAESLLACADEVGSSRQLLREATKAGDRVRNPYLNRSKIRRAGDFFGRAMEIQTIYSRLNASPPGCISIVGDRRIGKSSLLNFVHMRVNRDVHLEDPDSLVMVLVDLQGHRGLSLRDFLRHVTGEIRRETEGLELRDREPTLDGMQDLVRELMARGRRLAIVFDEFEIVTENPNFSLEFFSFLRYLANQFDVGYITSSVRGLQELCHTREIADSPFFNIFTRMNLVAFDRREAYDLVCVPSARAGYALEHHFDLVTEGVAGHFPLFLQIACAHLFEEGLGSESLDESAALDRAYVELEPHFSFLWESFDDPQRSVMCRLLEGKGAPDPLRHVLQGLEARGYAVRRGGHDIVFSEAFERFLKERVASRSWADRIRALFSR